MSKLDIKYNSKKVEENLYKYWLENNYFKANRPNLKPFTIVIPPPNVTGKLHLGHAWDNTIQDIIIRRKRMQGYNALYLPGMDHAGIATQAKVEEKLRKEGISRYDLKREEFLDYAWKWTKEYSNTIRKQWAYLGLSLDYSHERFTLDKNLSKAVNKVFIDLYNDGLIYRGKRIINWDPYAKTALSNIEVYHKEQISKLYYINYKLVNEDNYVLIATTRPETMFADKALMVNPKDSRYTNLIGKEVYIPTTNIKIPIIKDRYVKKDFATGIVKVTPAHDPNDFIVGKRHNLSMPLCMNEDGKMNSLCGKYSGLDRFECRKELIKDLKNNGQLVKIEDHKNSVGYSQRTDVMIEPRLSLQWFVKMDDLAKQALKTKVNFVPKRFKKIYKNWMENIEDWTISRQLWWGHRIPVWYKDDKIKVQETKPGDGWKQDEDVLDTWFSSALWPFSTLGWPNNTQNFQTFYPTNVLVTGYDIIFFWVSRMIFQGLYFTNEDPFEDVVIHGLVRAEDGRKMSKSYGNGVDPIDVINKYGCDSLRYFLTTNSTPGQDLRFSTEKVESSWNFINKLWNIVRFISINIEEENFDKEDYLKKTFADQWILNKLNQIIKKADYFYERYEFSEVASTLYNFIWNDFADIYLEIAKVQLKNKNLNKNTQKILNYTIKTILKLMHPFIPFVTEKLYKVISKEETIMLSSWPLAKRVYKKPLKYFEEIKDILTKTRNLRAEYNVKPKKELKININSDDNYFIRKLKTVISPLKTILNANITINKNIEEETILLTTNYCKLTILKSDLIDKEEQINLLNKQLLDLENEIKRSEKLLQNQNFINKANPEKVNKEKEKYKNYKKQYESVKKELKKYE